MRHFKRAIIFIILVLLTVPTLAVSEDVVESPDGMLPCTYTAPDEVRSYVSNLCDGDPFTTLTLNRGERLSMDVPKGASVFLINFYSGGGRYVIEQRDSEGGLLSRTAGVSSPGWVRMPVDEGAVSAVLISDPFPTVLSEWIVGTRNLESPFPDTEGEADILVVLGEPGEELTKLGGILPTLCREHGLSVQVMYYIGADGYHSQQCLQVLQAMGVKRPPYFGSGYLRPATRDETAYTALGINDSAMLKQLTLAVRSLKPKLVLTLNPDREQEVYIYGTIARTVIEAVRLAADAQRFPETEPFAVSKVYSLCETGETVITATDPLYTCGGVRADAFANELYKLYREERVFRRSMPETIRLRLERSAVGEDVGRTSLLEHLSTDLFPGYRDPRPTPEPTIEPTAEPTAEPTIAPTPVRTEAPSPCPTAEPEPAKDGTSSAKTNDGRQTKKSLWWLPLSIGAVLTAALRIALSKRKLRVRLLCLAPLAVGILFSILLLCGVFDRKDEAQKDVPQTEASPVPEPTAEPTTEPTEEPTPDPTPEPTPEPTQDPNDACFLSGDGEEYELDFENGHWWYKNNVLSIDIREIHTTMEENHPLVYYVADIRMREYTSYRSGLRVYTQPWIYAREEKAVLAITGDNLDNAEREDKGCLIRNGKYYYNSGYSETLVIREDMTLSVLPRAFYSGRVLLDQGVRDTYGFGPALVVDGKISDSTKRSRISHPNPRIGIGMVEPGHWVAIATEGRQPDFSYSITLPYFAQMFLDYGCTVAFNMDGGSSVGVVFMGEALNRHYKMGSSDLQRSWNDALLFGYSENVPSKDIPTIHDGYRHGY